MPQDIQFLPATPSGISEQARKEVERHQRRITGVTIEKPRFKELEGGVLEYVVNVRIGVDDDAWEVVQDVLIAQEVVGIITDADIPVTMERSEAGRLRVNASRVVDLPTISLKTYTYADLELDFMHNLQNSDVWRDGFGHAIGMDPSTQTGTKDETCTITVRMIEWGSTEFEWGVTLWDERTTERTCS